MAAPEQQQHVQSAEPPPPPPPLLDHHHYHHHHYRPPSSPPSPSTWTEDGGIVEEVGVGMAVTTASEDGDEGEEEREEQEEVEDDQVGIALGGDDPSPTIDFPHRGLGGEHEPQSEHEHEVSGTNAEGKERGLDVGVGAGAGVGAGVDVDVGAAALGSAGRSERSRSRSRSRSGSGSGSGSRSWTRSPLSAGEVGAKAESSVATSWTQAEEKRPSGESEWRRSEDRARSLMKEVVERVVQEEEEEKARAPRGGTEVVSPLDVGRREEVLVIQEEDIGEGWRPSRYDGRGQLQDHARRGEGEKAEGEEADVGSVHALESIHEGDASLEPDEKGRSRTFGSVGRNTRHLRLEFKQPSPQPWDVVDPPTENNETYTTDYYSTLNSKKFETLQKRRVPRRRPLIPRSSYYFGPPPPGSAFGSAPVGQMGVHHPREVVRIERDYGGGELVQFSPVFPLELEGRITPTQFHQTINDINEILISAHSVGYAFVDNLLAVLTLQLSTLVTRSHYAKEMRRLKEKIEEENHRLYNPAGLNILWPQKVAFLFLEIEYY